MRLRTKLSVLFYGTITNETKTSGNPQQDIQASGKWRHKWTDIEQLFLELGADIEEREGSRVGVFLFGVVKVFHRPHPSPDTDKRRISRLSENGLKKME